MRSSGRVLVGLASSLLFFACSAVYAAPNALIHLSPTTHKWSSQATSLPSEASITEVYDGPNDTSWAVGSSSTQVNTADNQQATVNQELGVKLDFYNGSSWSNVHVNLPTPGGNDWITSVYPMLYHGDNAAVITIVDLSYRDRLSYELLYNKLGKWQHQMLLKNQPQLPVINAPRYTGLIGYGAHVVALNDKLYIVGLFSRNPHGGLKLFSAVANLSLPSLKFKLYPMAVPQPPTTQFQCYIAATTSNAVYVVGNFFDSVPSEGITSVYQVTPSSATRVVKWIFGYYPLVNVSGNMIVVHGVNSTHYSTDGGASWQLAPQDFSNSAQVTMPTAGFGYFTHGEYCDYGLVPGSANCFNFSTKTWKHGLYPEPYPSVYDEGYAVLAANQPAAWFPAVNSIANSPDEHVGVVRFNWETGTYSPVMSCSAIPHPLQGSAIFVNSLPASVSALFQGVSLAIQKRDNGQVNDWIGTKLNSSWHGTALPSDEVLVEGKLNTPFSTDGRWAYVDEYTQSQK